MGRQTNRRIMLCCAGDEEDDLRPFNAVVAAVPEWKGLKPPDITVEKLTGGASGQGVYRMSTTKAAEGGPADVLCKTGSETKGKLACAALAAFSQAPAERNFCGKVYMAGDPAHPGIQVTEFAGGGSVVAGTMYSDADGADAKAYGKCLGLLHSHDDAWFSEFETGPELKQCFEDIGAEATEEWKKACLVDVHGHSILTMKMIYTGIGMDIKKYSQKSGNKAVVNGSDEEIKQAEKWLTDIGEKLPELLTFTEKPAEPARLMERIVVSHSDAHVGQFIHREKNTAGKLMLIDFDLLMRAPAYYDWGGIPEDWLTTNGSILKGLPYPSKEKRLLSAQAYIDAIGAEEAGKWSANTAEDVAFDVNKGIVARLLFKGAVMILFCGIKQRDIPGVRYVSWCLIALAAIGSKLIKEAEGDAEKTAALLETGVIVAGVDYMKEKAGFTMFEDKFWADA